MHSHHSHSGQFCKHAKSSLADVLKRAQELGFTHFHLSEHCPRARAEDLYPEEVDAGLDAQGLEHMFRAYVDEARRLQAAHAAHLKVLVGCETENIVSRQSIDYLCRVLNGRDHAPPSFVGAGTLDYMVGSVHHVGGVPIDFDDATYRRSLDAFRNSDAAPYTQHMLAYFDLQYEVMDRLRPEVIGHFDLFRLFEPDAPWFAAEDDVWREKLLRNIRFAVSYGALFEANSSAFRKGWHGETYPGQVALRLIRSAGGRIALSDDSHGTHQIALNYARVRDYLVAEHIDDIWYLEPDSEAAQWPHAAGAQWALFEKAEQARKSREQSAVPADGAPTRFPRGARAVRMGREWQEHEFWRQLPTSLLT